MRERVNIVVFIFTLNPKTRFLLLKRTANRGGFWQPVSCGVERTELPIQALYREVYEETGINNINYIIDLEHSYTYSAKKIM